MAWSPTAPCRRRPRHPLSAPTLCSPGSVRAEAATEFNASEPFTLTREATDGPDEFAWRAHVHKAVPADISTGIGDVLHNLASALDSVAYALASSAVGRELTPAEERASTFPICRDPDQFTQFFEQVDQRGSPTPRAHLFDQRARESLLLSQPFYWTSQATDTPADEWARRYRENFDWSLLRRLRALNNIDKHRRVATLRTGWPDLFWFGSDEGEDYRWRWGTLPMRDGEILFYLKGPRAATIEPHLDFVTLLVDDPQSVPGPTRVPDDFLKLLELMAREVWTTVSQVLDEYGRLGSDQVAR
jgi:hypothetical protein